MYRRILVPLDGTAFGDHALPYAISIALRTGATLELAHVHHRVEIDPRLTSLPQYQFEHVEEAHAGDDARATQEEETRLAERAADIEIRYGLRVVTRVLRGTTARALTHEATDTVADLVVMATHARSGLSRLRQGDLAHELVAHLNIPMLCVQPPVDDKPRSTELSNILVTLDGSEFSEQILDMVVPLARAIGARLSLLHVVSPASRILTGLNEVQRPLPHRGEAMSYLEHVASRMPSAMPQPELIAAEAGDAATAIIAEMSRGSHDALAIATHGRSGLSRLVLGSVAEEVLRSTDRPLLLYRPRLVPLATARIADAFRIHGE